MTQRAGIRAHSGEIEHLLQKKGKSPKTLASLSAENPFTSQP